MSNPDDLRTFGHSAEALEARIADAEARGVPVPPEAHAMLVSLRELAHAIADLQASLGAPDAPADVPAGRPADPDVAPDGPSLDGPPPEAP